MIPLGLFLLACAAVYLGAIEAAFSALMRLSLRLIAERSDRPDALARYLDDPLLLFIPLRLLLGIVAATVTALLARAIGASDAKAIALIIVIGASLVAACELLLPLVVLKAGAEHVLALLLPSFAPIARLLGPMTRWIARRSTGRQIAAEPRRPAGEMTPDAAAQTEAPAVEGHAESTEEEGLIEGEERRLLRSIVDFGDTLVREVMTPRPDIVAIRDSATVGELRALFREQEYSRFPVFKESLDNIAGFVFIKDLVLLGAAEDSRPITPLIRTAAVVPETKRIPELLQQFQRQQTQCAIVVDEYGGTAGLVTIEDLLEEIVGEIRDEYDVEADAIVEEGPGRFVFSGKIDIDEVARRLSLHIERQGFETLGGYLMAHLGRVPAVGERFDIDGLGIEVIDAERRRINKVRVVKIEAPIETEGP